MLGKQPATMNVRFLKPTFIAGARKEVGAEMSLPFSLASELVHSQKAERCESVKPEPAKAEPAKPAAKAKE